MKTIIHTTGMTCANCEKHVITALKEIEDIRSATASAKKNRVIIKHREEATIAAAKAVIEDAGYEVEA